MQINQGLEGIHFTETRLSVIDGNAGKLSFCGYDIKDLAKKASYEEVCYLLWNKRLPSAGELEEVSGWLRENRPLPKPVWGIMHVLPNQSEPMEALRTVASTLSMFDPYDDYLENGNLVRCQAVSLTAKFPTIVASFDRLRRDLPPMEPRPDLSHGANLLYMLTGREPDPQDAEAVEAYLVILADHGMNASTFSARVTTSTLGDVYSATVTALGTLKGPLHGGATEAGMRQLIEIGAPDKVDAWFDERMAAGKRIMGFGHRVYRVEDPRATILRQLSRQVAERKGDTHWHEIAARLEERVLAHPHFQERRIFANVDFFTGPLLFTLGLNPDMFTAMFAVSRVAGWTAHMMEQLENNRLIRPRAAYVGPRDVAWVEMEQRNGAAPAGDNGRTA